MKRTGNTKILEFVLADRHFCSERMRRKDGLVGSKRIKV